VCVYVCVCAVIGSYKKGARFWICYRWKGKLYSLQLTAVLIYTLIAVLTCTLTAVLTCTLTAVLTGTVLLY